MPAFDAPAHGAFSVGAEPLANGNSTAPGQSLSASRPEDGSIHTRSMFSGSQSKPQWVTPGEVRATTRDGTLVRLRVALDAPDSSTRSALESRLQQVGLLLEVSVAALSRSDLAGAEGLARLAHEMLQRLNAYLASEGVAPLKSVAIQDLWYTTR